MKMAVSIDESNSAKDDVTLVELAEENMVSFITRCKCERLWIYLLYDILQILIPHGGIIKSI